MATCPICDQVVPEETSELISFLETFRRVALTHAVLSPPFFCESVNGHIDSTCKRYLSVPSKPKAESWNGLFGSSSSSTKKAKNGASK